MVKTTIVAAAAVMLAVPAVAQNLLVNPSFDVADQLTGWMCPVVSAGLPSWSTIDRQGLPSSGSLQHDVDAASNNAWIKCSQCVPVTELQTYVASGWHYWPDDPDVDQIGSSRWSVLYYGDPGCTSFIELGVILIDLNPTLDTWHFLETEESTAPAGAMSAAVSFVTWQDFTGQPVRARFDDLDFSATLLFRDGFESGGVDRWSSSVP